LIKGDEVFGEFDFGYFVVVSFHVFRGLFKLFKSLLFKLDVSLLQQIIVLLFYHHFTFHARVPKCNKS